MSETGRVDPDLLKSVFQVLGAGAQRRAVAGKKLQLPQVLVFFA